MSQLELHNPLYINCWKLRSPPFFPITTRHAKGVELCAPARNFSEESDSIFKPTETNYQINLIDRLEVKSIPTRSWKCRTRLKFSVNSAFSKSFTISSSRILECNFSFVILGYRNQSSNLLPNSAINLQRDRIFLLKPFLNPFYLRNRHSRLLLLRTIFAPPSQTSY